MTNSLVTPFNTPLLETQLPSLPDDGNWGIDSVQCSFLVDNSFSLPMSSEWNEKISVNRAEGTETIYYQRTLLAGKANVRVFYWQTFGRCSISLNPAKVLFGKSAKLLPPGALVLALKAVIETFSMEVVPAFVRLSDDGELTWTDGWASEVSITEMEVARNFQIPSHLEKSFQEALQRRPLARNYVKNTYQNAKKGFTIYCNTKSVGSDKFYDKSAELGDVLETCEDGREVRLYRFEATLLRPRLDKFGLRTLSQVTDMRVWAALEGRMKATGWGSLQLDSKERVQLGLSRLSYRQREAVLGFNEAIVQGLDGGIKVAVRRDRTRLARSIGLEPGTPFSALPAETMVLSLYTGLLELKTDG